MITPYIGAYLKMAKYARTGTSMAYKIQYLEKYNLQSNGRGAAARPFLS
jgi:hypothetical protein